MALAITLVGGGRLMPVDRPTVGHNASAARAVGTAQLLATPMPGLSGAGVQLGQWDTGVPRAMHQDLRARVTLDAGVTDGHATLVAGTLVGSGQGEAAARGMAPGARLWAFDSADDAVTLGEAAAFVSLSSHAYGPALGFFFDETCPDRPSWAAGAAFEDSWFGQYRQRVADMDGAAVAADVLMVWSAGNGRMAIGDSSFAHYHWPDCATVHSDVHAGQDGFDTIGGPAVGKNALTVGAARPAGDGAGFQIVPESGFGPTDDGRIKPDLVAPAGPLRSTSASADDAYGELSGTSSAAPVVAGSLALAVERFRQLHDGRDPGAETLKALAVWGARRSPSVGPTYRSGYGMFHAEAVDGVMLEESRSRGHVIEAMTAAGGLEFTAKAVAGNVPVRVVLAWLDAPGPPLEGGADDPSPTLVNDLDLVVSHADGTRWFPWSLDPADAEASATRAAPNQRDTVEVVDVEPDGQPGGAYTVRVTGPGGRRFALVSSVPLEAPGGMPAHLSLATRLRFELAAGEVAEVAVPFKVLGDSSLAWVASAGAPWIEVLTAVGDQSRSVPLALQLDARGLAVGDHRARLTVTTDGPDGQREVGIWLRVGCAPACDERSCGPDPQCGGSCGVCEGGERCDLAGACIEPRAEGRCAGACTGSPDGVCYCDVACVTTGDCCFDACGECDSCAAGERCEFGRCVAGCNEDNCGGPCERCVGGECLAYEDGLACDDGDACTGVDRCMGGVCRGESSHNCPEPGPCERAYCDPNRGACVVEPLDGCQSHAGPPEPMSNDSGGFDAGLPPRGGACGEAGCSDGGAPPELPADDGCGCRLTRRRAVPRWLVLVTPILALAHLRRCRRRRFPRRDLRDRR